MGKGGKWEASRYLLFLLGGIRAIWSAVKIAQFRRPLPQSPAPRRTSDPQSGCAPPRSRRCDRTVPQRWEFARTTERRRIARSAHPRSSGYSSARRGVRRRSPSASLPAVDPSREERGCVPAPFRGSVCPARSRSVGEMSTFNAIFSIAFPLRVFASRGSRTDSGYADRRARRCTTCRQIHARPESSRCRDGTRSRCCRQSPRFRVP